jgi:hypothetical protein
MAGWGPHRSGAVPTAKEMHWPLETLRSGVAPGAIEAGPPVSYLGRRGLRRVEISPSAGGALGTVGSRVARELLGSRWGQAMGTGRGWRRTGQGRM